MRIVWFLGFIAGLTATGLPAFGQGVNGTITGTVTDPSGLVISAAAVEAANVETGALYTAASTNTGNYAIPNLPVGTSRSPRRRLGSRLTVTPIWPSLQDKS